MSPIIEITGLGKKYPIVHDKAPYGTLRDTLVNFLKHPFASNQTHESFWALKDINLTINRGDIVGIIGKNGAGKSTLLKILSGITKPTEGKVKLYGRVSSLLEVGTGFHPELTGRENIYLNGVILGMTRKEVAQKFDEIVAFASIEKFLDTPVKHYSSGMYVRLAFAVAAHLEPDILIVDEVLAVGDAEFQKKCLGKMGEISKEQGRTVLFVSHNIGAINQLCKNCVLLDKGKIKKSGTASEVTNYYSSDVTGNITREIITPDVESEYFFIEKIIHKNTGDKPWTVNYKEDIELEIHLTSKVDITDFRFGIGINKTSNLTESIRITTIHSKACDIKDGHYKICASIQNILAPGTYELNLGILGRMHLPCFATIQILSDSSNNTEKFEHINFGVISIGADFTVEKLCPKKL